MLLHDEVDAQAAYYDSGTICPEIQIGQTIFGDNGQDIDNLITLYCGDSNE